MSPLLDSETYFGVIPKNNWRPTKDGQVLHDISVDDLQRKVLGGAPSILARVKALDPDSIQIETLEMSDQNKSSTIYLAKTGVLERDAINLLFEGRKLNSPEKRYPIRIKWEPEV